MGAKRALNFGSATPARNAKKLRKLERVVYSRNLGEVKHFVSAKLSTAVPTGTPSITCLTEVPVGGNQGQRLGNEIRIRNIEVRGEAHPGVDVMLIQSKTAVAPTLTDFEGSIGSHIKGEKLGTQFNELSHWRPEAWQSPASGGWSNYQMFALRKRWSIPMKLTFNGPDADDGNGNKLYLVVINRSGTTINIQYTWSMSYTD